MYYSNLLTKSPSLLSLYMIRTHQDFCYIPWIS